jgi:arabinofuranosyltransferase
LGHYLRLLPWLLLVLVLARTAWVCDDAYISFRTVDQILAGNGPVFNVGERVQVYTHPLWMLLHVPFQAVAGNVYWVTLGLCFACSILAFGILKRGLGMAWMALPLLLVASKCLVEYASSGLENPLNFLLMAVFMGMWARPGTHPARLHHLTLIGALIFLNRMDAVLFVAPALAWAFWQQRSWHAFGQILRGLWPVFAWLAFSTIYYGFPFPNTAYAKLGTGIDGPTLLGMGWDYFKDSLHRDPISLPLIGLGLLAGFWRGKNWPLALGLLLYLVYVMRIGGDFMSGRFFALPFLTSVFLIGKAFEARPIWLNGLAVAAFGLALLGPTPMLLSGSEFAIPKEQVINEAGVADERAFFYGGTGMLHALEGREMPDFRWVMDGKAESKLPGKVVIQDAVGFFSYFAGLEKHIVDRLALVDPVIARIPARYHAQNRPGHYDRLLPAGYVKHLNDRSVPLPDSAANRLAQDMAVISRAGLFSRERWALIWKYNLGGFSAEHLAHFRLPVKGKHEWVEGDTTRYVCADGFGHAFSWGKAATHFSFESMADEHFSLAWLEEGIPKGGEEIHGAGSTKCKSPKESMKWPSTPTRLGLRRH